MIFQTFARSGEWQTIEYQTKSDRKSNHAQAANYQCGFRVGSAKHRRHNQAENAGPEAAGRHDHAGTHAAQAFLFVGLEEFFDLGQDVLGDAFEIARVFNLANLLGNRAANFFTCRHG